MASRPLCDPQHPQHESTRRALVKKLDFHILPGLSLLWLACFIDRTNVGNAKVAGMDRSLGLVGVQYNIGLAVFYVSYIASELPSNYILRRIGGKLWLPFLVASWGIITIGAGFMTNYASFVTVRVLLGLFEGGLLPGMVLYLSTMYKRNELQLRVGIFFASASLSGAFGGLLAFGIEKMDGLAGHRGWQWVFILEGIATVLIAIFAICYLPTDLATASFLSPSERAFAMDRMNYLNPGFKTMIRGVGQNGISPPSSCFSKGQDLGERLPSSLEPHDISPFKPSEDHPEREEKGLGEMGEVKYHMMEKEQFEIRELVRGLLEVQVWLTGVGYMSLLVGLYSYSLFLPTIVASMGHKGSSAQLFSAFPYLPASVLVVVIALIGDRLQLRGPMVLMLTPVSMIGYIISITVDSNGARYASVFLMAAGIYPSVPSILCILPNNTAGITKRSAATAMQLMIANCAGFIATFIYTSDQAPMFKRGHTIALAFTVLSWVMFLLNSLYCWYENRARALGKRSGVVDDYMKLVRDGKTQAPIGDRAPEFRFTI